MSGGGEPRRRGDPHGRAEQLEKQVLTFNTAARAEGSASCSRTACGCGPTSPSPHARRASICRVPFDLADFRNRSSSPARTRRGSDSPTSCAPTRTSWASASSSPHRTWRPSRSSNGSGGGHEPSKEQRHRQDFATTRRHGGRGVLQYLQRWVNPWIPGR